jgi:DNA-binding MarR family transcriptional regulator
MERWFDQGLPQLVPRARSGAAEAIRDREMLAWIARFRFVNAQVLALRFGVSKQQVNARMRRLEAAGLVERKRDDTNASWTIATTRRGARAIGEPERRSPRTTIQREHELELARLTAHIERGTTPPRVLTERESRQLEADTNTRYSADTTEPGRGRAKRWPDLLLETAGTRDVLELERTPKGTARLKAIVEGYSHARWFTSVTFITPDRSIARRLERIASDLRLDAARDLFPSKAGPAIRVVAPEQLDLP